MFSMKKKRCLTFSPQSKRREGLGMDQAGCHNWEQLLKLGLWDRAWGAGFCLFQFPLDMREVLGNLGYLSWKMSPGISLYLRKSLANT